MVNKRSPHPDMRWGVVVARHLAAVDRNSSGSDACIPEKDPGTEAAGDRREHSGCGPDRSGYSTAVGTEVWAVRFYRSILFREEAACPCDDGVCWSRICRQQSGRLVLVIVD